MKRAIIILYSFLALSLLANGQEIARAQADTIPQVDTLVQEVYVEKVFEVLDGQIVASDSLNRMMSEYREKNFSRNVQVYRLRIFFDNKQDARSVSEQVVNLFREQYPDIPVFRGYTNPYFKVTVGNFRSKSEAMKFLNEIKAQYPSVFLVRETFSANEA